MSIRLSAVEIYNFFMEYIGLFGRNIWLFYGMNRALFLKYTAFSWDV